MQYEKSQRAKRAERARLRCSDSYTQAKDSEIKSRAYPFVEGYALFFATALKMQHTEHQYRSNLVDHLNYGWSIMLYWHRNQSKYIVV